MVRLISILVLASALTLPMHAQKGKMRNQVSTECRQRYNQQNVKTIKGTINKVKQISTTKNMTFGTHLLVDYEGEELEIHLGPSRYLEKKRIKLRKDDIVEVSGAVSTVDGKRSMIAKWIVKQGDTTYLRGNEGLPKWNGKRKNKKGGANCQYKS